ASAVSKSGLSIDEQRQRGAWRSVARRPSQHLVHAAGAKSGEVEGDIRETKLLEAFDDRGAAAAIHEDRHPAFIEFDTGDLSVMTDPQLAQTQGAQERLGGL